jgi:hypothetical protein
MSYSEIQTALFTTKQRSAVIEAIEGEYAVVAGVRYPLPRNAQVGDAVLLNGGKLLLQPKQAVDVFYV